MSLVTIRECDLDSCDTRVEVKDEWPTLRRPKGWVSAQGHQFCGYEHLIAWAQQQPEPHAESA